MRRSILLFLLLVCAMWPAVARAQGNPFASCKSFLVEKQEMRNPVLPGTDNVHEWRLLGRVKIVCDEMLLQAEEIVWRDDQDMIYASGDVYFEQKGTQVFAEKAEMNRATRLGTFMQAAGYMTLATETPHRTLFGIQEPYILFWAEKIEKVRSDKFVLTRGGFTSCTQPTPRWDMSATKLTLVPGEHAILTNMLLRVKDVPLFYLPGLYFPINKEDRATGILLPTYGSSTIKGMSLSNAFFWVINRSQDVTLYHDLFTRTGQGLGGEYRYAGEAGGGNARLYMIAEHDVLSDDGTLVETSGHRSYDFRGNVNQAIGRGVRVAAQADYFTDIATQQLYQQSIYDLSLRTRSLGASVTAGTGRYRMTGQFQQTDLFYGTRASRYGSAPSINFTVAEKPIGQSPIYFSANVVGGLLLRTDDVSDPTSQRNLWRVDAGPKVSVPVSQLPWLQVTASAAFHYTHWTKSLDPDRTDYTVIPVPLTRQTLDLQTRVVGPIVSRIWHTPDNGYAAGFKHLFEPFMSVGWLSSYSDADRVVRLDSIDFLTTGTTTLGYGITNRLLAKRRGGGASGDVREILSVDLRQTYYTNSAAAQYDAEYASRYPDLYSSYRPPTPFSPIRLATTARPSDTSTAQFSMEYDPKYSVIRNYSISGGIDEPAAEIDFGWSRQAIIPEIPSYVRAYAYHFLNLHMTLKDPQGGIGGTFAFNYDILNGFFVQKRYRMFYNSQCCGVAFDFQTADFSAFRGFVGIRTDRRMSLSFTLAGIGTFSNPLGAFGGATRAR